MEFVRFDLHRRGEPSEDAPHIHIRLESKHVSRIDESIEIFNKVAGEISHIEKVIR